MKKRAKRYSSYSKRIFNRFWGSKQLINLFFASVKIIKNVIIQRALKCCYVRTYYCSTREISSNDQGRQSSMENLHYYIFEHEKDYIYDPNIFE